MCRHQGLAFVPVALDQLGGFHPVAEAGSGVKKLGEAALAGHTGQDDQLF